MKKYPTLNNIIVMIVLFMTNLQKIFNRFSYNIS